MLGKAEIREITKKFISKPCKFIEEGDALFYREHLKKQVKNAIDLRANSANYFENVMLLNLKKVQ